MSMEGVSGDLFCGSAIIVSQTFPDPTMLGGAALEVEEAGRLYACCSGRNLP